MWKEKSWKWWGVKIKLDLTKKSQGWLVESKKYCNDSNILKINSQILITDKYTNNFLC